MKLNFELYRFATTAFKLHLCNFCRYASQNRIYIKRPIKCYGSNPLYPKCYSSLDKFDYQRLI